MMVALRTMVEALRTADICLDDVTKAREWLLHKDIKKLAKGSVCDYDFLSKAGVILYSTRLLRPASVSLTMRCFKRTIML